MEMGAWMGWRRAGTRVFCDYGEFVVQIGLFKGVKVKGVDREGVAAGRGDKGGRHEGKSQRQRHCDRQPQCQRK